MMLCAMQVMKQLDYSIPDFVRSHSLLVTLTQKDQNVDSSGISCVATVTLSNVCGREWPSPILSKVSLTLHVRTPVKSIGPSSHWICLCGPCTSLRPRKGLQKTESSASTADLSFIFTLRTEVYGTMLTAEAFWSLIDCFGRRGLFQ